jgi:hypothetical protein
MSASSLPLHLFIVKQGNLCHKKSDFITVLQVGVENQVVLCDVNCRARFCKPSS